MTDEELRKLERLVARMPRRLHAHDPVTDEWYGCFREIRTAEQPFRGALVALAKPDRGEAIVALLKAIPELLAEIRRLKALAAERENVALRIGLRELVRVTIPAVPVAQPRQRQRVVKPKNGDPFVMNYTPRKGSVQDFKATVRLATQQTGLSRPAEGPVVVNLDFYLPRPKRLMRAKDPEGALPHTAKPDRDNLEKAVLDALKGLAWRDDGQVFDGRTRKWYAEKDGIPRVEMVIWEVASAERRAS